MLPQLNAVAKRDSITISRHFVDSSFLTAWQRSSTNRKQFFVVWANVRDFAIGWSH